MVPAMSPQGAALALRGFHAAGYKPSARTLARAAEAMQRQLLHYKPSEIATCMDAFAAFRFTPPSQLLTVSAQRQAPEWIPHHLPVAKRCLQFWQSTGSIKDH